MPILPAMEFNVALQTASYSESDTTSVRWFRRDAQRIAFASFQAVGDDGIEIKLVSPVIRGQRDVQIAGLINYFADLFQVTLYVELDDRDPAGRADIKFMEANGFTQGRPFGTGNIPLCRPPRSMI